MLDLRSDGSASSWSRGAWPTPTASRSGSSNNGDPKDGRGRFARAGRPSLDTLGANWGTPLARDGSSKASGGRRGTLNLQVQAGQWSTPTVSDAKASRRQGYMLRGNKGSTLTDQLVLFYTTGPHGATTPTAGRVTSPTVVLNPEFVEALQGFPRGWSIADASSSDVWETPLFRSVPR